MHQRADVVYLYDGSLQGLLCCIFACYEHKEMPSDIQSVHAEQMILYSCITIETDFEKASRVKGGILRKGGGAVYRLVEYGFHTCLCHKELVICRFVHLAMAYGADVLSMLTDDTVQTLQNAVNALTREAHQYLGFARFSICGGVMVSMIEPKNDVLFLLAPHFCDRYANDAFMIYDKTYKQMLLYRSGRRAILPVENYEPPDADKEESQMRALWKLFYDTIAIEDRHNPACRRAHMQKRYWKHLTEMNESVVAHGEPEEAGDLISLPEKKEPHV